MSFNQPHVIVLIGPASIRQLAIEIAEYFLAQFIILIQDKFINLWILVQQNHLRISKKIKHFLIDIEEPINPIIKVISRNCSKINKKRN